ncbi:MAG TPA: hypothetical protein VMA37_02615 [Acetobacteraceae bacterium]|nr:hypothetical protein [Acetobacteraceae bacterium]
MSNRVLVALAILVSLAGCNGAAFSGSSAGAAGSPYGEETLSTDAVGGDFGVGSGAWAAPGLAGGSLYNDLVNKTGGGH